MLELHPALLAVIARTYLDPRDQTRALSRHPVAGGVRAPRRGCNCLRAANRAHQFLSPRTVDMHVRNLLRKLDARTRVDAARRAGELGLLV
jgi:hypothetical protein